MNEIKTKMICKHTPGLCVGINVILRDIKVNSIIKQQHLTAVAMTKLHDNRNSGSRNKINLGNPTERTVKINPVAE